MESRKLWKQVKDYPNYEVSNYGEIKSLSRVITLGLNTYVKNETILRHWIGTTGYPSVTILNNKGRKHFKIHRLVAIAFIPNPESKPFINHKNGVKTDYSIKNIEWCTAAENNKHSFSTGLRIMPKGKTHYFSKLIMNNLTGIFYDSMIEAAASINMCESTFRCQMTGHRTNKTNFIYA